ncbi:hypothetical protein EVAR_54682_1 [Eumeta japonica]|uniref:HTH psq-type domain-containing protein n=1 Tax=Eumeta variegata TaxID=151549 RepID=A0A4C1X572_EUMVA|nr:hypothetical protein EVAR_54682_1 [Eumeta japonica]
MSGLVAGPGSRMPKSRPRSTNKAQWSSDTLSKAENLINGGLSIRQAAKFMDIPFSSLQKRLKNRFANLDH